MVIKPTYLASAVRLATVSLAGLSALTVGNFASAQDDDPAVMEEIYVTGSRIARDGFSSSSPLDAFTVEQINSAGMATIDEFLKDVPAFTGYQMGTSTNNGSAQGQAKLDMRGLGFERTLVLVNGRRQIGDVNGDGAVDLNTIPKAMIKSVEVLKDGASTIYGSDALAGVVNIILHDDFEGVQLTGNWGQGTEDGQAENYDLGLLGGVQGEKGGVVVSYGYTEQKEMLQAERSWAENTLYPNLIDGEFVAVPSGSSNSRRIRDVINNDDPSLTPGGQWIVDETTGQARPFDSSTDLYNFAPVNALITPQERHQFGLNGHVNVNESVRAYGEFQFTKRISQQRLAPDASFRVGFIDTPNFGNQRNDFVPFTNPFNPFGVNGATLNPDGLTGYNVSINRRFEESGGRLFRQSATNYRMLAGVEGEVAGLNWDVSYLVAENEVVDETKNLGRFDRWATAVDPAACAADPDCAAVMTQAGPGGTTVTALNPFGPFGSITPEQIAYLSTNSLKDQYFGRLESLSFNIGGEITELPGGIMGWAAGYETREEEGFFNSDEFLAEGLTTSGASDPQAGSFSVDEFFGELRIPVLENLVFDLSARYSDYDTVGDTTNFKLGGEFAVNDSLRLRAGYSTGFRAPNISEINQDQSTGFPVAESVCEFGDRRLAAGDISETAYENCQALGIPTDDSGEFRFAWQSAYTTEAPDDASLKPEESTSFNFGFVFTPSALPGLSLSLDYWDIEVEELIDAPDYNDLFQACMNSEGLSAPACDAFPEGPYIFGLFPGDAVAQFGNLGTLATNGYDIDVMYQGDINNSVITGYSARWSATLVNEYIRDFDLTGPVDLVGTADGFEVFPELRYNLAFGLQGENWSVTWDMRYIDETEDLLRPASITDDAVAEDVMYHDLVGNYSWNFVNFTLGINNLTDEDAPRFHSAFNANTEPGMYDVIGRRLFTSVSLTF